MYQIDLIPQLENGLWVVREELLTDDEDNGELVEEYRFKTEAEADAFIDRWMKDNCNK
jgi:hypothetical protein